MPHRKNIPCAGCAPFWPQCFRACCSASLLCLYVLHVLERTVVETNTAPDGLCAEKRRYPPGGAAPLFHH